MPTSLRIDFLGDERQQAERGGGNNITIKLKRKATYDIENAKGLVCDGVLRVVVPKVTLPKVDVKVASGAEAERPPAEESEVTLKFAVAGYSSSDISVELDAERERLKIFGELKDKSSEFERVVPVPRGLRAEHVTLCAVENGVLELRLRDPLAIEKRIVPVLSTSPPPLPSPPSQEVAAQVNQPMMTTTTITGSGEEEKKPTEQQDNRVVLMKTEVPGYSAKDIECCINVDRTIEAKEATEEASKSASRTQSTLTPSKRTANTASSKSSVKPNRPSRRARLRSISPVRAKTPRSKKCSNSWKTRWSKKTKKKKKTTPCS